MSKPLEENSQPLLKNVSQFEVDFVIPRVGIDLPIGIDPFLLFKSRDPNYLALHSTILDAFNSGINLIRQGEIAKAKSTFDFPEVSQIGMGYSKNGKSGSGVGFYLSSLITQTLVDSPLLVERGIRHIEEMQLVSVGIGPDRISDISANIIKEYLIGYTQKQCGMWDIPLVRGAPIDHIYDPSEKSWKSGYYDLPISPVDGAPIILVPRRMVRALPWINYEDFFRMEFAAFLRAKKVRKDISDARMGIAPQSSSMKEKIVQISRNEIDRIEHYINAKESSAVDAQPSITYLDASRICQKAEELKARLQSISTGAVEAIRYQKTILEILNYLFNPELVDGELEVKTFDGTERRDIIFTNDSDQSFWNYLRNEHSSIFLMFETKNTSEVEIAHINQTAVYLGDRLGRLGFIVTRNQPDENRQRKLYSIYNDSNPRKIVLVISDVDIYEMLDSKCRGNDPMRNIQSLYRKFRTRVQ